MKKELKGVVDRLRTGTASEKLLAELQELWMSDFARTTRQIAEREGAIFQNPQHAWEDILTELLMAASSIQVRTINGLAGEALDYEKHKEDGLDVIAIGGDKLSRGLTLEGLSVSYFLRCSRMYDTLMQMGRWFGYRPGYLDLCRLFTTSELCGWFHHIANATEELRGDFNLMANSGGTPKDFGLRVRSHPVLMVTSAVKMRAGARIPITFEGDIVETISFYCNAGIVDGNWNAAEGLIERLDEGGGTSVAPPRQNCAMWSDVAADKVISFLEQYVEHESASKVRTRLLREYIEKEAEKKRLRHWTVLVSGGSKVEKTVGDTTFKLVERGWHTTGEDSEAEAEKAELRKKNKYVIRRLVNPPDERVDLDQPAVDAALKETIDAWKLDPKGRDTEPTTAAGRFSAQAAKGHEWSVDPLSARPRRRKVRGWKQPDSRVCH